MTMTTKRKPGRPATGHDITCPICGAPMRSTATARLASLPEDAIVRRLVCTSCGNPLSTVETAVEMKDED